MVKRIATCLVLILTLGCAMFDRKTQTPEQMVESAISLGEAALQAACAGNTSKECVEALEIVPQVVAIIRKHLPIWQEAKRIGDLEGEEKALEAMRLAVSKLPEAYFDLETLILSLK